MEDEVKSTENTEVAIAEAPTEGPADINVEEIEKPAHQSKQKAETKEPQMTYYENAKVICSSCGTTFTVGSTKPEIHVEVCSKCHPFFTGQAKFVDTEGRVEAFQRRVSAQKTPKEKKQVETKPERPKSLKEMLELIQSGQ